MTQTGSEAQHDVLLHRGWREANRADSLLFHRQSGAASDPRISFEAVADAVGTLRESTYRQQLSGAGNTQASTAVTRLTTI